MQSNNKFVEIKFVEWLGFLYIHKYFLSILDQLNST